MSSLVYTRLTAERQCFQKPRQHAAVEQLNPNYLCTCYRTAGVTCAVTPPYGNLASICQRRNIAFPRLVMLTRDIDGIFVFAHSLLYIFNFSCIVVDYYSMCIHMHISLCTNWQILKICKHMSRYLHDSKQSIYC